MSGGARLNPPSWMPSPARLASLFWASRFALSNGWLPEIAISLKGGLGDDIMCGVVAHELKKRGARKIWQLTRFPELFEGNPDVRVAPLDFRLRRLCEIFRVPFFDLEYPKPPRGHLIAAMCSIVGIRGEVELRPRIYLTESERRTGFLTERPQIAIQTSSLGARYPMRNKQWAFERFQTVADDLSRDFDIVQIGLSSDPVLRGARDYRAKTTVREDAAILAASHVFIGLEGGLMHLARAVDCRSVIIYGGRVHPSQTGYPANENLYWSGTCAPCWQRDDCDYERICLSEISTNMVTAAARRQSSLFGTPLPVDTAAV